jgi:hypothetical protein
MRIGGTVTRSGTRGAIVATEGAGLGGSVISGATIVMCSGAGVPF